MRLRPLLAFAPAAVARLLEGLGGAQRRAHEVGARLAARGGYLGGGGSRGGGLGLGGSEMGLGEMGRDWGSSVWCNGFLWVDLADIPIMSPYGLTWPTSLQ